MSEINFELSSSGGTEVAETIEDVRVKMHLAGEETKRLSAELRQIKDSGQVSAQGIQSLTRELVRAQQQQAGFIAKANQMEAASTRMAGGMRSLHGGGAEVVNMLSEASLGLGAISPQMRELTTQFATAGNNVAQLARVLPGPYGIIVGLGMTAIPILVTKIIEWNRGTNDASNANRRLATSARNAAQATRDLVTAMQTRQSVDRMATIGQEGSTATSADIGAVIDQTRGMRDVVERELARARAEVQRANRERMGAATGEIAEGALADMRRHERAVADLERNVRNLRAEEERLLAAQSRRMESELSAGAREDAFEQESSDLAEDPTEPRRARAHQSELDQRLEREERFFNELQTLRDRDLDQEIRTRQEVNAAIRREDETMRREQERESRQLATRLERQRREAERDLERSRRESERALQQTRDDALEILTPAVQELSGAISEVIAGSKSADEAFQGLLASFLEMIAQQAALEAAKEFASAIASFASQDYGGGALHLAAGVAWTAVAVASGAASIAVAPPAAATPASPQASAPAEGGRGGDTVININGAIAFAGTRAELGREMGSAIELGDRRFGRAA